MQGGAPVFAVQTLSLCMQIELPELKQVYGRHNEQMFMGFRSYYQWDSGWWFGTFLIFPFSWECHHPN